MDTSVGASLANVVKSITESFGTKERLTELREFVRSNDLGTSKTAVNSAIQTTEANLEWMDSHYEDVANWLQAQTLD